MFRGTCQQYLHMVLPNAILLAFAWRFCFPSNALIAWTSPGPAAGGGLQAQLGDQRNVARFARSRRVAKSCCWAFHVDA